jgi:hypothetical protein
MFIDVTSAPYNAAGDGSTDDRTAFVAADGVGGTLYVPRGSYRIAANLSLGSDVRFEEGATLLPDAGVTVTLAGSLDAGPFPVFDLGNTGSVVISAAVERAIPQWWGAAATGAGNDGAAIQAAIDSVQSAGGGIVYFPPGTYRVDTTSISVPADVTLAGAGYASFIDFYPPAASPSVATPAVLLSGATHAAVRRLRIRNRGGHAVNRVAVTLISGAGNSQCVHVLNSDYCTVEGCTLEWGGVGISVENTTDAGTYVWSTNRYNTILDNVCIEQGGSGIQLAHTLGAICLGNSVKNVSGEGYKIRNLNRSATIDGNYSEGNGRDGYDFYDGLLESTVTGNVARDNSGGGFELKGTLGGSFGGPDYVWRDNTFAANVASANTLSGFTFTSVRNSTVSGCEAVGNATHGFIVNSVQMCTFNGCVASKNTQHGFWVTGGTGRTSLVGCAAFDNSWVDGTTQNGTYNGFDVESTSAVTLVSPRTNNNPNAGIRGGQGYGVKFAGTGSFIFSADFSGANVTGGISGATGNFVYAVRTHAGTQAGCYSEGADGTTPVSVVAPRQRFPWVTLAANSSVPSVSAGNAFVTANTSPRTITNFTSGADGQRITVKAGDPNTTLANNATIATRTGANRLLASGDVVELILDGSVWREMS